MDHNSPKMLLLYICFHDLVLQRFVVLFPKDTLCCMGIEQKGDNATLNRNMKLPVWILACPVSVYVSSKFPLPKCMHVGVFMLL